MSCERCSQLVEGSLVHRASCPMDVKHPRFTRTQLAEAVEVANIMLQKTGFTPDTMWDKVDRMLVEATNRHDPESQQQLRCTMERVVVEWIREEQA